MQADGYRRRPTDTDINRHMPTTRGGWGVTPGIESGKHTEQMVCEPHYKRDFSRVGGGSVGALKIKGKTRVDTGGGLVYTLGIHGGHEARRKLGG